MLAFGTDVMFSLNGGHIWPLYEAARDQGMRVVDTRHEQTATFAAEGWAKLTRRPGLAALTAGPGITNGVSAITTAHFNGSPLVVLGGRAPELRWGSGSLQEMDHIPVVSSITKSAATVKEAAQAAAMVHAAASLAMTPHRGPTFLDFPLDVFGPSAGEFDVVDRAVRFGTAPDSDDVDQLAAWSPVLSGPLSSSAATSIGTARGTSCARRSRNYGCLVSSTGSDAACCPPTTSLRSSARVGC